MSEENNLGMREIGTPENAFRKVPKKKVIGLVAMIVIPLVLATPFIIDHFTTRDQREIIFKGLDLMASSEANATHDASATFTLHLEYLNQYEEAFTINEVSIELALREPLYNEWTPILVASSAQSQAISRRGYSNLSATFTIWESESEKKLLLERIITKSPDFLQLAGELKVAQSVEGVPNIINFNLEAELKTLFDYDVSEELGPSTFLMVDLHTLGENSEDPTLLDFGVDAIYENPFEFPISFENTSMIITNKTSETGWGEFSFSLDEVIEGKGNTSFFAKFGVFPDEISFIVSDLLNGSKDTFFLREISSSFYVGNLSVSTYRESEAISSNLVFELTIDSIGMAEGGQLKINVKIVNPCNLAFNISYVYMNMFVTGTKNKVLHVDQAIDTGNSKILCLPYSDTMIEDLVLDVSYANFIQNLDNNFDLFGYILADCYNFDGIIYFGSHDVDLGL